MKTVTHKYLTHHLLIGLSLMGCINAASAQSLYTGPPMPDPARWTQEDVTPAQKLSTATKEAVNGQQQSLDDCKLLPAAQRPACVAEAHMNYQKDMADINMRFKINPPVWKKTD